MTGDQLKKLVEALDRVSTQLRLANQIAVEAARGQFGDDTDKSFAVRALSQLAHEARINEAD